MVFNQFRPQLLGESMLAIFVEMPTPIEGFLMVGRQLLLGSAVKPAKGGGS
jgi:hypothetical protein